MLKAVGGIAPGKLVRWGQAVKSIRESLAQTSLSAQSWRVGEFGVGKQQDGQRCNIKLPYRITPDSASRPISNLAIVFHYVHFQLRRKALRKTNSTGRVLLYRKKYSNVCPHTFILRFRHVRHPVFVRRLISCDIFVNHLA